jgi:hypothetical protein
MVFLLTGKASGVVEGVDWVVAVAAAASLGGAREDVVMVAVVVDMMNGTRQL